MKNFELTIEASSLFKRDLIKRGFPLKGLTSFQIGGNAEFFFEPSNQQELLEGLKIFLENKIPLSIIGGGSNLLISDKGISGAVLSLRKLNRIQILLDLNKKNLNDKTRILVEAGAGVLMEELTNWAIENSVSGLESFGGLPGTVGGACFMNARCYDSSISDIIYSVKTFSIDMVEESLFKNYSDFNFAEYLYNKKDWDYKKSPFQKNADGIKIIDNRQIIFSVIFELKSGNQEEIKKRTDKCRQDRIAKGHFKAPSAGSTFKNNRSFGKPSGKIIEEAGLKGFSIGGAQVAPWHGNFVINKDNASSEDVVNLIQYIQKEVQTKIGFLLEPEVILC